MNCIFNKKFFLFSSNCVIIFIDIIISANKQKLLRVKIELIFKIPTIRLVPKKPARLHCFTSENAMLNVSSTTQHQVNKFKLNTIRQRNGQSIYELNDLLNNNN